MQGHPVEVQPRIFERGELVDRRGHVCERGRPAPAGADATVLDVPHGEAAPPQVAGQPAREDLAVALLPGAAVDQDHHRVRPGAGRHVEVGALGGVRPVAMGAPAREEVEDQARASHVGSMP